MAYYYVKNGGTATGDAGRYTTQQTGSFADLGTTNYYSNVESVNSATTLPAGGDYVIFSDLHSYTTTVARDFSRSKVTYVSVDDVNIDQPRTSGNRAAEICNSGTNDVNLSGSSLISGLKLQSSDDVKYSTSLGFRLIDCEVVLTGSGDRIVNSGDGKILTASDSEISLNNAGAAFFINGGSVVEMSKVDVKTTQSGVNVLFTSGFTNGGGVVRWDSSDLSVITGSIINGVGGDVTNDDLIDIHFSRCKMAMGVAFVNETFKALKHRAIFSQCADNDTDAEYQYHVQAYGGNVNEDTSIYREEDEAFPISNQKISYEIVTNADASQIHPFWFDFPDVKGVQLSQAGNKKLALSVTCDNTLTDKDIYMEVTYPDGTNYTTSNKLSTAPQTVGGGFDILATPTTLTTDAGSNWTGGLTNEYILEVDTTSLAGADCAPSVRVFVTKPNETINISSELQVS